MILFSNIIRAVLKFEIKFAFVLCHVCLALAVGAWLKAASQPTLVMSISPCDFIMALHLWLGIPLLLSLPLCTVIS